MNIKVEKKEYEAPKMTIVEMEMEACLLSDSGFADGEVGSDDADDVYFTN
ncbi:MAG: hypothetical protein MJY93_05570 [Fibrobacter sp.]|nr:hypothetical protein [Fibrobacter sp.]